MAIKEVAVSYRSYYKTMRNSIRPKYEKAVANYEQKLVDEKAFYNSIKLRIETYKTVYKIDLMQIPEFVENKYIDGLFYDNAKD